MNRSASCCHPTEEPSGIIWALTVTEVVVFVVGVVIWLASRRSIDRGLAEGSPERAEAVVEEA
jgi:multidrug efflux pump